MDASEAFRVLGLASSATEDEIDARYRELARKSHPDRGGASEEMQRLNIARDVARSAAARVRVLMPADIVRDIVIPTITAVSARAEVAREVEVASRQIKQHLTNNLRRYRELSILFGGLSAAALFLGKDLPTQFFGTSGADPGFIIATLSVGMCSAVVYWLLKTRIERAERGIDELSAYLSFRSHYVAHIIGSEQEDPYIRRTRWTFQELERRIDMWHSAVLGGILGDRYRRWALLAREAGSEDFARLLLTKGKELELLKREEEVGDRFLNEYYTLL